MNKNCQEKLIWEENLAKQLFNVKKLWPSYIGFRKGADKTEKGALPVLIWPEQHDYLNPNQNQTDCKPANLKRKRESEETIDMQENVELLIKKPRNSLLFGFIDNFRYIFNSVISWTFGENRNQCLAASKKQNQVDEEIITEKDFTIIPSTITETAKIVEEDRNEDEITNPEFTFKSKVFQELQRKEYFVGPGDVYGGDYVLYKGSPADTHSTGTIRVNDSETIAARDLISFSRVQNQVAKSTIVAFPIDVSDTVTTLTDMVVDHENVNIGRNQTQIQSPPSSTSSSSSPSLQSGMAVVSDSQNQYESFTTANTTTTTTTTSSWHPAVEDSESLEDMSQTDDGNDNSMDGKNSNIVNIESTPPHLLDDDKNEMGKSEKEVDSKEYSDVGFLVFNFQGVGERL